VRLFLHTARTDQVRAATKLGILGGLVTSPMLLAEAKRSTYAALVIEFSRTFSGPVVAMLPYRETAVILAQSRAWAEDAPNAIPGVPVTANGLSAISQLTEEGMQVCGACVASAAQGLLAASAGAAYISILAEPLLAAGADPGDVVTDLAQLFEYYSIQCQIIAEGVTSSRHLLEFAKAGAHAASATLSVLTMAAEHPLTGAALIDPSPHASPSA